MAKWSDFRTSLARKSPITHGHKGAVQSRNFAIASMFGVITGAWLVFRSLSPKHGTYLVADEERAAMQGGRGDKFPEGNRRGKVPEDLKKK